MARTSRRVRVAAVILSFAAAGALSGCTTVSTESDQVALHYSGGAFSSKKFQGCVNPGTRELHGPGEGYFVYPTSQRSLTASNDPSAEMKPLTVVSKDSVELSAPVTVTFTLNTSCDPVEIDGRKYPGGMIQLFHERLGNRYGAYWNANLDGDSSANGSPKKWVDFLKFAVGQPLDTSYDRVAQGYTWRELWNNPAAKAEVERQLNETVQSMVDTQLGAPAGKHFLQNFKVLVLKPDPTNQALKDAVASEQAAVSKAQSAEAQAKADKMAAEAQVAVAVAKAQSLKAERDVLGEDWIKKYAIDQGISPWPNPVVAGQAPTPSPK